MRYLPDGEQMKAADTYTIETLGIPSPVLMERAALSVVETMRKKETDVTRTLVVCGSGNNGGDGFAVARLLREEGEEAEVFFAGKESSLSKECGLQKKIAEKTGTVIFTEPPEKEYTVIIDAVFGVGLSREISGRYREAIEWMNRQKAEKVAVDIPSGICARTGKVLGVAFQADFTVSMACVKLGCELFPGKSYAGETIAVPIGISPKIFRGNTDVCFTLDRADLPDWLPKRRRDSHKGTYGKVLMITGSSGMAGAAYLSAKAAYAAGAGLVQIYTSEDNRTVLQSLLPEAIISCYREYDRERLEELLNWADVIGIGCGLGKEKTAEQILNHTLFLAAEKEKTCVIDADGLNLLSREKEMPLKNRKRFILTPHLKEMSRLTGREVSEIAESRFSVLQEFTEKYSAVCVLKDSRTVVAQAGRSRFVNLAGNSAMAKAGAGDVLAGVITGLAAQGMDPYDSAVLGVFLHACGGDEARNEKGGYSVLARDLIEGMQRCIAHAETEKKRRYQNHEPA